MEGSEMGKRRHPLLRHRLDVEQGSNPSGCGRKTSAMDWKSIRKTLEAGTGEPASWFTGVALDADGRWASWKQGRLSRDHSAAEATQARDWWSLGRASWVETVKATELGKGTGHAQVRARWREGLRSGIRTEWRVSWDALSLSNSSLYSCGVTLKVTGENRLERPSGLAGRKHL